LTDKTSNIGHDSEILSLSVNRTMSSLKGIDWNTRFKNHFNEPVSNITSTKAAIPEYDRELIDEKSRKVGKKDKTVEIGKSLFMQEYAKYNNTITKPRPPKMLRTKISRESSLPNKNRSKVHDCILDVLEQNNYISTVFDMAEWNISKNSSKTLADICIKAQYGAKREFYVINVGSKACARVLENMFEEICKQLPNEMISVPGDKKMLVMQNFINQALSRKGSKERVFFVNGDCTKWSAAETMECFASMVRGLAGHVDMVYIKYMMSVISMWGSKQITIPISLLQNTFFITPEHTKYLESHTAVIESSQNFLQGMFNYMSSFKAVCSSNFARDIWYFLNPKSNMKIEHMEHSDDYSLIITTESEDDLVKFRALHRMVMKCHGFNDSVKKTNTQQFLMEFISLVSLNGHMTYPHIKKLKECGMNLGCTGYRDDMDSALSRVGEAVRVGTIMTSAYFMQRCHIANVCRAYSLMEGQRNSFLDVKSMVDLPIELFGIPDTHPILAFLCKGMSNNYRIQKFCADKIHVVTMDNETFVMDNKTILRNLLQIEDDENKDKELVSEVDFSEGVRFYHPRYSFDMENNLIKKIRERVKLTFEESVDFWDKHRSYNFVKPKDKDLLRTWMKAMYFRHNFSLAYSRNSRAQITLRLSTYTSKKCCVVGVKEEGEPIMETMHEYIKLFFKNKLFKKHKGLDPVSKQDLNNILKTSMNCDATVSTIYSFFSESRTIDNGKHTRSTVATLTPTKINWLNINNSPPTLTQYMFNFDDFMRDVRYHKGLASLNSDQNVIQNFYGKELNSETKLNTMKSVYTDINLSQNRRNLCMSYSNSVQSIEDFLRIHIEYGSIFQHKLQVISSGVTDAINPHSGLIYFKKLKTATKNPYRALIDDLALSYSLMRHSYSIKEDVIRKKLGEIYTYDPNDDDKSTKMSGSDLLGNKTLSEVKSMGFTQVELKSFSFLKAFFKQDSKDLSDIMNEDLVYTYQYTKLSKQLAYHFSESVKYDYQFSKFEAYRIKNSNQLLIITNNTQKKLLTDAYLIAQRLFNIITQGELESSVSQTSLKILLNNKYILPMSGIFGSDDLLSICNTLKIQQVLTKDDNNKGIQFSRFDINEGQEFCFACATSLDESSFSIEESIHKQIEIDWEQNSVFVGNKKTVYTPNFVM
jgi:hypothetical protein